MSAEPVDPETLPKGRGAALTRPRPGHADLVGMQKYGFDEARNVLERASARETAARVALGAVARAFLGELGIRLVAHTLSIGPVRVPEGAPLPDARRRRARSTPTRCAASTPRPPPRMVAEHRRRPRRRRHPRRRRRGARLRCAAGARQLRALGPPPRRAARRRAHGHPGDQGRRGRRRLRRPPDAADPQAHDELVDGRRHHPRAERQGGRHRGRHDARAPCCACAPA